MAEGFLWQSLDILLARVFQMNRCTFGGGNSAIDFFHLQNSFQKKLDVEESKLKGTKVASLVKNDRKSTRCTQSPEEILNLKPCPAE